MARRRPWRAVAYLAPEAHEVQGRARPVVARAAACSEDALAAFVVRHVELGHAVDLFEVPTLDGMPDGARA